MCWEARLLGSSGQRQPAAAAAAAAAAVKGRLEQQEGQQLLTVGARAAGEAAEAAAGVAGFIGLGRGLAAAACCFAGEAAAAGGGVEGTTGWRAGAASGAAAWDVRGVWAGQDSRAREPDMQRASCIMHSTGTGGSGMQASSQPGTCSHARPEAPPLTCLTSSWGWAEALVAAFCSSSAFFWARAICGKGEEEVTRGNQNAGGSWGSRPGRPHPERWMGAAPAADLLRAGTPGQPGPRGRAARRHSDPPCKAPCPALGCLDGQAAHLVGLSLQEKSRGVRIRESGAENRPQERGRAGCRKFPEARLSRAGTRNGDGFARKKTNRRDVHIPLSKWRQSRKIKQAVQRGRLKGGQGFSSALLRKSNPCRPECIPVAKTSGCPMHSNRVLQDQRAQRSAGSVDQG